MSNGSPVRRPLTKPQRKSLKRMVKKVKKRRSAPTPDTVAFSRASPRAQRRGVKKYNKGRPANQRIPGKKKAKKAKDKRP